MMFLDTDPQLFLAETYGSKPKLESEKIDLNKIDLETRPLSELISAVKSTFAYKFIPTEPHQVIYDRNILQNEFSFIA